MLSAFSGPSNGLFVSAILGDLHLTALMVPNTSFSCCHISLEALRCDPNEQSRDKIPFVLSMLANDSDGKPSYGNLCRTFEARSANLPAWIWLPWLPNLLTGLYRVEARAVGKATLIGILQDHPQALYYSLRSFYLERRDIERSKNQTADDNTSSSARLAEEFMSNLRKAHPVLWSRLESILEDLIVRFRPSYEIELLHAITALLHKTSKPEYKTSRDSGKDQLDGALAQLGTKFFHFNKNSEGSISRKLAMFQSKYSSLFKSDFLEAESLNAHELAAKLQKWKDLLELGISRIPSKSNLREVSPALSWFSAQAPDLWAGACESKSLSESNAQHDLPSSLGNVLYKAKRSSALAAAKASLQALVLASNAEGVGGHCGGGAAVVEIPGQYAPTTSSMLDSRPFPELHAKLVRFHQNLKLTSSSTKHHVHQITMLGSDGKEYKWLLQLAIPYWIRTDERSAQLNYIVNRTLARDNRACRRGLSTRPSAVIPVAQRMRMSSIESSHKSLDSVSFHVQGSEGSRLMSYFQGRVTEVVASRVGELGEGEKEREAQVTMDAKLEVYRDVCSRLAPPNVLSRYMMDAIPSTEQLFQFRHAFASQLALNSLLQYALAIVERTPSRFAFCNVTGVILSQDFRSQYNHGKYSQFSMQSNLMLCSTLF